MYICHIKCDNCHSIMPPPKKAPSTKSQAKATRAIPVRYTPMDQFDKLFISFLHEGETAYQKTEMKTLVELMEDNLLMIDLVRRGISYTVFAAIQKLLPLTIQDWEDILNLNMRSVMRYKAQGKSFKPMQSEKILEIGHLYILGLEVFGDKDRFCLWLITPSYALGNRKPVDLLKDSFGQELVENELIRISYGILA